LDLPADIRTWNEAHLLRYLTRIGWDLPGSFIVGDEAYGWYMRQDESTGVTVKAADRGRSYPEFAAAAPDLGNPGSSAAGEQPKFLAIRDDGDQLVPVLVKYSPAGDGPVARRVASLLAAEHLALDILSRGSLAAARSSLLRASGRVFLEVERFDREGLRHRRGICTLDALDAEFIGSNRTSWFEASRPLAQQGIIPFEEVRRVHVVERFGQLIGNTDRHFGNLSFYMDGTKVTGLAPIYDMLPMHYAPSAGELRLSLHPLPGPSPEWGDVANQALDLAEEFWLRVRELDHVDDALHEIAEKILPHLESLRTTFQFLPR